MMDKGIQKLRTMRLIAAEPILLKVLLELRIVLVVILDRVLPRLAAPVLSYLVKNLHFIVCRL